jgi:regulator of sigma E protease
MSAFSNVLQVILLIFAVVMSFNLIIFVHELGHFLAAKWRGLKIERFQIWFGAPIWKKNIGGVQYGLGWIPAGGFVALPQMAPMEALEGGNKSDTPLPTITPLDKIIVAFAGPRCGALGNRRISSQLKSSEPWKKADLPRKLVS